MSKLTRNIQLSMAEWTEVQMVNDPTYSIMPLEAENSKDRFDKIKEAL
jgi:hypothetical protein